MKKVGALLGLAVLVSGALVFVPSLSHSAQKGKAASTSPGKTAAAPSTAKTKGVQVKPGGKDGTIKQPGKGKGTAVAKKASSGRVKCMQGCSEYAQQCTLQSTAAPGEKPKGDGGATQCMLSRTCQKRCDKYHPN
jgi:hypothetical protein